jgi:hypothetical protein
MAKEELKWQNIDADDLPSAVKKSFGAIVEAEAAFKADLEKLLKTEGHMPEDKFPGYEPKTDSDFRLARNQIITKRENLIFNQRASAFPWFTAQKNPCFFCPPHPITDYGFPADAGQVSLT